MIVVFGSINLDVVVGLAALPAPGETVLADSYQMLPGGKGANQAVAAAHAGATVEMVGRVGTDPFADLALAGLRGAGVGVERIVHAKRPTGLAFIGVDAEAENQIIVASGANREVASDQVEDALLRPGAIVVAQMEVPPEENWKLFDRAKARGARVILNIAPALPVPLEALRLIDLLVVNGSEARYLTGAHGIADRCEADDLARQLALATECPIVITLGRAGAVASTGRDVITTEAMAIDPVDATGAGDAFVGALATALDTGRTLTESLPWAAVAGSLACLKPGAQSPPTADEIDTASRPRRNA